MSFDLSLPLIVRQSAIDVQMISDRRHPASIDAEKLRAGFHYYSFLLGL
jgi:hypothetical protein